MDRTRTRAMAALVAAAIALTSGCGSDTGSETQDTDTKKDPKRVASESQPGPDRPEQIPASPDQQPSELSAAHILIMYKGSEMAPAEMTRSKEEALALAQEIAKKAKAKDADFAGLAKEYSEGPSGPGGGNLGNFPPEGPRAMVKPFSDATLKLAIGEVSEPVETQFGYHVIRRQEIQPKVSAKHILVQYGGSERASADITRSKEEAYARIEQCLKRSKDGEKFEDLAREYSDGPSGPRGGDLGEFPQGMMAPAFDEAVFAAEVGDITGIIETPFGYHIIHRYK